MRSKAASCARSTVHYAVKVGRLPRANTVPCVDCGGPAEEYDHYLGYEAEQWLAVQAVCHACHWKRTRQRRYELHPHMVPPTVAVTWAMRPGDAEWLRDSARTTGMSQAAIVSALIEGERERTKEVTP